MANGSAIKNEISGIQFKIYTDYLYGMDGSADISIYLENIEDIDFPQVNKKYQWFDYTEGCKGEIQLSGSDILDTHTDSGELEYLINIPLEQKVIYSGKSLLITIICENNSISDYVSEPWIIGTNTYSSTYGKCGFSSTSANLNGSISGTPTHQLPILCFDYAQIIEQAEGTPVTLQNVVPVVENLTADPALNQGPSVNEIAIHFDVNDPTNCGEYEIAVNDKSVGSIHSTSGTLNFFAMPTADVKLSVIPKGEGVVATDMTVSLADFEALFANPTVSTEKTALYGAYNVEYDKSISLEGAAQFKIETALKAAWLNASMQPMFSDNDYPANIERLLPPNATNYKYLELTEGLASFHVKNAMTLSAENGIIKDFNKTTRITVAFGVDYPVATKAAPVLVEGRDDYAWTGEYALAAGADVAFAKVSRRYNDGSGEDEFSARLNAADENILVLDITYPKVFKSEINRADKTITFFAPAGHTIWYAFEPDAAVATFAADDNLEWKQAETNPYTVSFAEFGAGTVHAKAVSESNEESETHTYYMDAAGDVSGIESVEVDGDAAVEYFNLQGVRVDEPAAGLYIRRQGAKATKVYVK